MHRENELREATMRLQTLQLTAALTSLQLSVPLYLHSNMIIAASQVGHKRRVQHRLTVIVQRKLSTTQCCFETASRSIQSKPYCEWSEILEEARHTHA